MESSGEETKGSVYKEELIRLLSLPEFPNDLKTESDCLRYIVLLQRRIIAELEERVRMKDVALENTANLIEKGYI